MTTAVGSYRLRLALSCENHQMPTTRCVFITEKPTLQGRHVPDETMQRRPLLGCSRRMQNTLCRLLLRRIALPAQVSTRRRILDSQWLRQQTRLIVVDHNL